MQTELIERSEKVQAFREAYKWWNYEQRRKIQRRFCAEYSITNQAFRRRLSGITEPSQSEIDWLVTQQSKN